MVIFYRNLIKSEDEDIYTMINNNVEIISWNSIFELFSKVRILSENNVVLNVAIKYYKV